MLARNTYPAEYIDGVEARIEARLAAFRALAATAPAPDVDVFEPLFLNDLVIVLHASFEHRTRAVEGKDGNALNEVRLLYVSLTANDEELGKDSTFKLPPDRSILGLTPGDRISLSEKDFRRLSEAFFTELRARFAE